METTLIKENLRRRLIFMGILLSAVIFLFLLNIALGSVNIPLSVVARALLGKPIESETHQSIVLLIRLPRALATLAGGACLALSGLLLQIFFNNPIVEPYVLGISSGARMFVGIVFLGGYTFGLDSLSPMLMFWGSLAGAMIVMVAVLFAANRVKSIVTLLVIGMMTGYLCSAVNSFLTAFAEQERIASFTLWSMGGFSGFTWSQVRVLLSVTTIFSIAALLMSKSLNALLMGENYAQSMGVGIRKVRLSIVFVTSVLTAVLTAYAGPISFVGLAVPHLIRMSFHTSDNRILLPASILGGALMTSLCDLMARTLFAPRELPIGALTSLIGTPLVIYMLLKRDNQL